MICLVGGFGYPCRSKDGCGCVLASFGIYGQGWAKVGRSGWVRLIGQEWVICLVGQRGHVCRSRGGCRQLWSYMGKGWQR